MALAAPARPVDRTLEMPTSRAARDAARAVPSFGAPRPAGRWNRRLDRLAGAPLWSRLDNPYRTFVVGSFAAAAVVAVALARALGMDAGRMTAVIAAGIAAALGLAAATRLLLGYERYVSYHYQLLALLGVAAFARLLGGSVPAHLDVAAVAMVVAVGGGRLGCQMAGCCHGRPSSVGFRYRAWNGATAADPFWTGTRVLPIPLLEALGLAVVAASMATLLLARRPAPGTVFALVLTAYAVLRFALELGRGDTHRGYRGGLSEAQWTALGVTLGVVAAGRLGWLPDPPVTWLAALALGTAALLLAATARRRALFLPEHLREIVTVLRATVASTRSEGGVFVGDTPRGVRWSASVVGAGGSDLLIAFSRPTAPLRPGEVNGLERLVRNLLPETSEIFRVTSERGVHHLICRETEAEHAV